MGDDTVVFLAGDLNFRLVGEEKKDELTKIMEEGRVWAEDEHPQFYPTCKRKIGMGDGQANDDDDEVMDIKEKSKDKQNISVLKTLKSLKKVMSFKNKKTSMDQKSVNLANVHL